MDWHLHVESLEQLQRAQDQLHQEQLARAPQAQFLQMDHEQPQDHQDLDQDLDDHQQDHRADQQDPQDPFWQGWRGAPAGPRPNCSIGGAAAWGTPGSGWPSVSAWAFNARHPHHYPLLHARAGL